MPFQKPTLEATAGMASRPKGGLTYSPHYLLDSVLLSDRLLVKDDLQDTIKEQLGTYQTLEFWWGMEATLFKHHVFYVYVYMHLRTIDRFRLI